MSAGSTGDDEPDARASDVARALDVHVATVSRALRQVAGVSPRAREQVRRCAEEMGYRPNPLVSALIRSRRDPHRRKYHATLGYLIPSWPGGEVAYRRDYRQMMDGAAAAADFGYRLEFVASERLASNAPDRYSHDAEHRWTRPSSAPCGLR
jgi:DNA-binding LacI/PurR family transcriptional regulator